MIKKNFNMSVGVSGEVTLEQGDKKNVQKNTITNEGLKAIVHCLLDNAMAFRYIAVGDEPIPSLDPNQIVFQTALESEIARNNLIVEASITEDIEFPNVYEFKLIGDFGGVVNPELAGKQVTEIGLFDKARLNSGTMLARQAPDKDYFFDTEAKLLATWRINLAVSPNFEESGGVVNKGTKIIAEAMNRKDDLALKSEGYPWGINLVSLGGNNVSNVSTMEDLNDPRTEFDTPPTITNVDFTGDGDKNFRAKLIIQKYIPPNTVDFEIKEVGLFNQHRITPANQLGQSIISRTMFSRVPLEVPIAANEEAVLTWNIFIKRQETIE